MHGGLTTSAIPLNLTESFNAANDEFVPKGDVAAPSAAYSELVVMPHTFKL